MTDLVAGANMALPHGPVSISVGGGFDVSALVLGVSGRVSGDHDFVFYNQPSAPGVTLAARAVTIEPARLRSGAARVVLIASPEQAGHSFGQLPQPTITVSGQGNRYLARIVLSTLRTETAAQLAEIYQRDARWKIRAIGQGYADGLAGLARDFGVDVADDTPSPPDGVLGEVITLTNVERARAGLRPLAAQTALARAAQVHSEDMVARAFFAHENPDGAQVWDRAVTAGYTYRKVAENIAAGQRTPAEVVQGWMNSPGHRANIMDAELTEIGVGVAHGGSYSIYWTQVFGTPR